MQSRFTALESSHNTIRDVYTGIAQRSGMNPENVIVPIRSGPSSASVTTPQATSAAPKAGPIRIDINGKPL